MKPSTVLTKAKKLIEKGWCKYDWATTIDGKLIPSWHNEFAFNSPKAAKFCALGALYRASNIKMTPAWDKPHVAKDAQNYLKKAIGEADIVAWNNRKRSSESVIQGFDRAIKLAKSEGK